MSSNSSSKEGLKLRPIETRDIRALVFHHAEFSRTKGLYSPFKDERPAVDHGKLRRLLGPQGQRTSKAVRYLDGISKKLKHWEQLNDKAYAYIVAACEAQQSPMEVVYHHADAVEALPPGTSGAGQPPMAVKLLAALVKRFGQANNIGIVQQAIAEFHSLSLAPNEKLETFINRLTAAMRRLHGLGKTDVDLDVYCLGRLKESLLHDSRYSQIALTLRANTTMTWDEAVDLLLSYEMTLAPGTSSVTVPRALAGGVDAPATETVKKLQAEVKTLNRALSNRGAGKGKRTPAFTGECYKCGGPHKKQDCPKLGKGGIKGRDTRQQTCTFCKKTGHLEATCFTKRREQQAKQLKRTGVDDAFDDFEEEFPSVGMLREKLDKPYSSPSRMMRTGHRRSVGAPTRQPVAVRSSVEAEDYRTITMDSGASSHFLTEETTASIDFTPYTAPVAISVDTAKKGASFKAIKAGSAGNMSRILVSDDLGDDVASIGRFDRDNCWWTLMGNLSCVVYDGDPGDRTKPPPNVIAKGTLGKDNLYRVPLGDLIKARERIRVARIAVPTERILGASAVPTQNLELWHKRLAQHHYRGLSEGISQGLRQQRTLSEVYVGRAREPSRSVVPSTMDGGRHLPLRAPRLDCGPSRRRSGQW
jgi:hypothetical protein